MIFSGSVIVLIILLFLGFDFILTSLADFLNLRNMKGTLPEEFHGIYDSTRYEQSQAYLKTLTAFGFITRCFDLLLILGFWFFKGFPLLDTLVRSWHLGPIATGLAYTGILVLAKEILMLPFSLYETFNIEHKFGFNRTTLSLFFIDLIKSTLISALLGGTLLAIVLVIFQKGGPQAWLTCWVFSAVFLLGVQAIVPLWILPLFNTYTPLEQGRLRDAITQYAESIKFPLNNIFVMDGSKRSAKSNAFFIGFGKTKRIVLFDTLISNHTVEELLAILAHEMGHFKKKHIVKRITLAILQMGIIFYLISVFVSHQGLFDAFFMEEKSIYAGLIFFGLLYAPIDLVFSMMLKAISRHDEYQADGFASDTIPDRESLIQALKKLSTDNLSNLFPHPLHVFLNNSHPPVLERIRAIRLHHKPEIQATD